MIQLRSATAADIPFITEAILASEASGTDTISYCRIFGISQAELTQLIEEIFDEEIEGQEWYLPNFRIAEKEGEPAACLSTWIEGQSGMASGIIKAQILSYLLGKNWKESEENLRAAGSIQIPRIQGALQLENIYTARPFRGKGIAAQLIESVISEAKKKDPNLHKVEIQLMANNTPALRSYTKCGFLQRILSPVGDATVLNLLPGNQRVSLVKAI